MRRQSTFLAWSSAALLRRQIRKSLEQDLQAGVFCARCKRQFHSLTEYTHDGQGKPICFPDCGGGHDLAA